MIFFSDLRSRGGGGDENKKSIDWSFSELLKKNISRTNSKTSVCIKSLNIS